MFPLPLDFWKYLKFQLTENEASIVVYRHSLKSRERRMKFGLKHTSTSFDRSWEHVRMETSAQLSAVKRVLGFRSMFLCVRDQRASRKSQWILSDAKQT